MSIGRIEMRELPKTGVVGRAIVQDKDGVDREITIEREGKGPAYLNEFIAVHEGVRLGHIRFDRYRYGKGFAHFGSHANRDPLPKAYPGEGPDETGRYRSRVFIHHVENEARGMGWRGVGKALMQAVFEYAILRNAGLRVSLEAVGDAHGFYYKLGMRHDDPSASINRKIKASIAEGVRLELPATSMFLVEWQKWCIAIAKKPVLEATSRSYSELARRINGDYDPPVVAPSG